MKSPLRLRFLFSVFLLFLRRRLRDDVSIRQYIASVLLKNNIGIEDVIRMDLFAVSIFTFIGGLNSNSIHSEESSEDDEEGEDERSSAVLGNGFPVEEEDEEDNEEDEGDEEEEE
jgi:hypothetical protein